MRFDRRCAQALATAALALLVAVPAGAQTGADDNEFRVNTTSPTKQRESTVAFSPDGGFTVVWRDLRAGITARFFPAHARPSEDVVLVPNLIFDNNPGQGTIFSRLQPVLVYLEDGTFLLFWTEEKGFLRAAVFHYDYDILEQDIFAQRFSAEGRPVGARFRVHSVQSGLQRNPAVAVGSDGDFLIAWDSSDGVSGVAPGDGIFARRFNSDGLSDGAEFKIDQGSGVSARLPALTAGRDGYMVVWEGEGDGTEGSEVYGRLLDAEGDAVGPQFQLNATTLGEQRAPAVATGSDGNYMAVWYGRAESPIIYRVFGQAIGSDGALLGPELRISQSEVERAHALPEIAAAPNGEFLVAWLLWFGDFQTAVEAVRIDPLGNLVADDFRISQRPTSSRTISLAAGPRGDYLATWEGFTAGNRPEDLGIAARRIPSSRPLITKAMPVLTLGLGGPKSAGSP